jgi:cbb3-type cytochrome oxidase subunit 3
MFKQFLDNVTGTNIYLITSLWIFLIFFVLVAVMLIKANKEHIEYMSELPLNDDKEEAI